MRTDDPAVLDVLRRSMVARIATLSRSRRPSITPLYFVFRNGHIWLGTSTWTLAAREVKADPRVTVLFEVEHNPRALRILRITGRASVRTDRKARRSYVFRVAFKYSLTPGGIYNNLANFGLLPLMHRYHAQSAEKGQSCIIEVTPERVEFLDAPQPS